MWNLFKKSILHKHWLFIVWRSFLLIHGGIRFLRENGRLDSIRMTMTLGKYSSLQNLFVTIFCVNQRPIFCILWKLDLQVVLRLFRYTPFRFKKVTAALVAAGHNLTVVTPQADVSSHNVHYIYMEKVYESVYRTFTSDSKNIDPFDFGQTNPFAQLSLYCGWLYNICSGFVESDGWETLKNYPNDFKVRFG